jgi:hypothetical protein
MVDAAYDTGEFQSPADSRIEDNRNECQWLGSDAVQFL